MPFPVKAIQVDGGTEFDLSELRDELLEWERIYNAIRPHQTLGYMTPLKFLEQRKEYSGKAVILHL